MQHIYGFVQENAFANVQVRFIVFVPICYNTNCVYMQ